ncbi:MAG: HEAT repeat domain-containing protein [Ktedonobacteraceae bacterium]
MSDHAKNQLIERQLIDLASDAPGIYETARAWFVEQGPGIVPALVQALDNDRLGSVCHWRILLLLRYFAQEETLPALLRVLHRSLQERDYIVLPGAMEAIAVFHDAEAVNALIALLQESDSDIVKHAAILLGQNGDMNASKPLIDLLSSTDPFVRYSAAKALIKLGGSSNLAILKQHLDHEKNNEVRSLISEA